MTSTKELGEGAIASAEKVVVEIRALFARAGDEEQLVNRLYKERQAARFREEQITRFLEASVSGERPWPLVSSDAPWFDAAMAVAEALDATMANAKVTAFLEAALRGEEQGFEPATRQQEAALRLAAELRRMEATIARIAAILTAANEGRELPPRSDDEGPLDGAARDLAVAARERDGMRAELQGRIISLQAAEQRAALREQQRLDDISKVTIFLAAALRGEKPTIEYRTTRICPGLRREEQGVEPRTRLQEVAHEMVQALREAEGEARRLAQTRISDVARDHPQDENAALRHRCKLLESLALARGARLNGIGSAAEEERVVRCLNDLKTLDRWVLAAPDLDVAALRKSFEAARDRLVDAISRTEQVENDRDEALDRRDDAERALDAMRAERDEACRQRDLMAQRGTVDRLDIALCTALCEACAAWRGTDAAPRAEILRLLHGGDPTGEGDDEATRRAGNAAAEALMALAHDQAVRDAARGSEAA